MNWGRVKTIFIFLFLICDIFLLGNLIMSNRRQTFISPEIITSTVSLLEDNNIEIDPQIISNRTRNMPFIEAENVVDDFAEFAKKVLGEDAELNSDASFSNDTGSISFSGDSFSITTNEFAAVAADEKNAEKTASSYLERLGFDLSSAQVSTKTENGGSFVTYAGYVGGFPLFDSRVTVTFLENGALTLSGAWFNPQSARGEAYPIKSMPSILIDSIPSLLSSTKTTIEDLRLGYIIPEENTYHKSAMPVPSLQITVNLGSTYYEDARNPQ